MAGEFSTNVRVAVVAPPAFRAVAWNVLLWLICWVPIAMLIALDAADSLESFVQDAEAQARLFVSIPVLLFAARLADRILENGGKSLCAAGVLTESQGAALMVRAAKPSMRGYRLLLTVSLALFALLLAWLYGEQPFPVRSWRHDEGQLLPAGIWYAWVSTTVYRYLWLRWLWGLLRWFRCILWVARVARPNALHPDKRGGMNRLIMATLAFAPLIFGISVSGAGSFANQLLYRGRTLEDIRLTLIAFVVVLLVPVIGALMPLVAPLFRAKRETLERLSVLAAASAQQAVPDVARARRLEPQLSTDDRPPLAAHVDLIDIYAVTSGTAVVPLSRKLVLMLVLVAALPMLPVLLIEFPLGDLLRRIVGLL